MQQVIENLKNLVRENPYLSTIGWIAIIGIILGLIVIICLCARCVKLKKRLINTAEHNNLLNTQVDSLSKNIEDLEQALKFVREQLEKEKIVSQDLATELAAELNAKVNIETELEQLKAKIIQAEEAQKNKRLEATKKAAETRKKNKEAKNNK